MANLDFKSKKIMQNTFCFLEWNAWMLCNANPRNKESKKTKTKQRAMVTKSKAMKHKDHVRKTHLDWAFCIQNFLDAPRALEFLFTLEWFPTLGLE